MPSNARDPIFPRQNQTHREIPMRPISIAFPFVSIGAAVLLGLALSLPLGPGHADSAPRALPAPAQDVTPGGTGLQTAVFAGGCFWGVQGVFEHVKGVTRAVSGYAGGHVANPDYEQVSSGATGHAESVSVTFDPSRVSYGKLLQIFFSVALDPTEVDRQGPDWGHAVPFGAVRQRPGAGAGGAGLPGAARGGARVQPSDRDTDRCRRAVLSGRGLSPGLPGS